MAKKKTQVQKERDKKLEKAKTFGSESFKIYRDGLKLNPPNEEEAYQRIAELEARNDCKSVFEGDAVSEAKCECGLQKAEFPNVKDPIACLHARNLKKAIEKGKKV